jgi:hypothetical protein
MSLCEGEMLLMKHKHRSEVGYFVVAKLDKPQTIVLVPHWDARAATPRKNAEGNKVPDSNREQFSITPSDLKELAPLSMKCVKSASAPGQGETSRKGRASIEPSCSHAMSQRASSRRV